MQVTQGLWIGVLPLLQFAVAVGVIAGLQLLFYRTALGRAFRATSDDPAVAPFVGPARHVFALAMALSLGAVRHCQHLLVGAVEQIYRRQAQRS